MSETTELKNKILRGEKLSPFEIKHICYSDNILIVDEKMCEETRWYMTYRFILEVDGRFFSIYFNKSKSEYSEDEAFEQVAEEVEKKEVVTYKWIKKE